MATATYNKTVIAQSDNTIMVEGNHYFPLSSVNQDLLKPSNKQTVCPWKGMANYYDVLADGKTARAAAWYYVNPKEAASQIKVGITQLVADLTSFVSSSGATSEKSCQIYSEMRNAYKDRVAFWGDVKVA